MVWTATIAGKQFDVGSVEVIVDYTDGVQTKRELLKVSDGSLTTLKSMIAARCTALERLDTLNKQVTSGAFDPTLPPPPAPDPVAVSFQAWLDKLNRLRRVQELITLGVLTGNEAAVTNLRDQVRTDFQAGYINRF